jgi:hypothetical protein
MITDLPLDEDIERAVDGFFDAVVGEGRIKEGRREFFRIDPEYQGLVVERAVDRLHASLPHTMRSEVERAVKKDFLRLFGFPTDGNA